MSLYYIATVNYRILSVFGFLLCWLWCNFSSLVVFRRFKAVYLRFGVLVCVIVFYGLFWVV